MTNSDSHLFLYIFLLYSSVVKPFDLVSISFYNRMNKIKIPKSFGDVSPYICSYKLSSVCVAEGQPFGKELSTRLTVCSLCILTICNFSYFSFWF